MADKDRCPQCGRPLEPNAPEGLCPVCLLKRAMDEEPSVVDMTPVERDRNLAFGVFAVQLGMITPKQLVEMAAAWLTDPRKPLADLLIDKKLIKDTQRSLLDRAIEEALANHHNNPSELLDSMGGSDTVSHLLTAGGDFSTGKALAARLGLPNVIEDIDGEIIPALQEEPGRYTKTSEYTRGGMGRILLVHDAFLAREVALKELLPERLKESEQTPVGKSATLVARFLREARVTGQLEHPNIVPVYELGQRASGTFYYTMKLVRGEPMSAVLKKATTLEERMRVLPNFIDICQAVAYAHSRNVIHRDLKPSNIMVGAFGESVVIDWGLAKIIGKPDPLEDELEQTLASWGEETTEEEHSTETGARIGTPAYMSPEQARGEVRDLDPRTDVFSLGVVLYEILTGQLPYTGPGASKLIRKVGHEPPPDPAEFAPDAPPELLSICRKALRHDRSGRYDDAGALAMDLRRFMEGALVSAYSYKTTDFIKRFYRRHRPAVHTAAAAALILLIGGIWSYFAIREQRDQAVQARDLAEREAYASDINYVQSLVDQGKLEEAEERLWETTPHLRNWEWGYLLNKCNDYFLSFDNYVGGEFSPDGTEMALFSNTDPISFRDAETGEERMNIPDTIRRYNDIAYSPDGQSLAGAGLDGVVRIWDVNTGQTTAELRGHTRWISRVIWNNAGTQLASIGAGEDVRLWDSVTGEALYVWEVQATAIDRAGFTYDDEHFVCAHVRELGTQGTSAWSTSSGDESQTWPTIVFAINPQRNSVYLSNGPLIEEWEIGSETPQTRIGDRETLIMACSQGGDLLAAWGDGRLRIYSTTTGSSIAEFDDAAPTDISFSPDGSMLLSMPQYREARLYSTAEGQLLQSFAVQPADITALNFDPTNAKVLLATLDQRIRIWETSGGIAQKTIVAESHGDSEVAVSPTESAILHVSNLGWAALLNSDTGEPLESFATFAGLHRAQAVFLNENTIIGSLDPYTPIIVDLTDPSEVTPLQSLDEYVFAMSAIESQGLVHGLSSNGTVFTWDASTGELARRVHVTDEYPTAFVVRNDGETFVIGTREGSLIAWNATAEDVSVTNTASAGRVRDLVFRPGSHFVYVSQDGNPLSTWNTENGERTFWTTKRHQAVDIASQGSNARIFAVIGNRLSVLDTDLYRELASIPIIDFGASLDLSQVQRKLYTTAFGKLNEYTAAPWQTIAEAQDPQAAYDDFRAARINNERFSAQRNEQADGLFAHVYTTEAQMRDALERLLSALRTQDAQSSFAENTLSLSQPSLQNAVKRICLLPNHRITSINQTPIENLQSALQILEGLLSSPSGLADVTIGTIRYGRTETIEFHTLPIQSIERNISIPRQSFVTMASGLMDGLQRNSHATVEDWMKRVVNVYGYDQTSWPGFMMQLGDSPDPTYREFQRQTGLWDLTLVEEMDERPITSSEVLMEIWTDWLTRGESGEDMELAIQARQGEFRRLLLKINIQ